MHAAFVNYAIAHPQQRWPDRLVRKYDIARTEWGGFEFERGSPEEIAFGGQVQNLDVLKTLSLRCSDESIHRFPYFHFLVSAEDVASPKQFLEGGCNVVAPPLCWNGARQEKLIIVNTESVGRVDMFTVGVVMKPAILLVSRRCKDLLQELNPIGCTFVPCLSARQASRASDTMLDESTIQRYNAGAEYYQVAITTRVHQVPCVGRVLSIRQECDRCGAIGLYSASELPGHFHSTDLAEADFQTYDGFHDLDGHEYVHIADQVIVSRRVMEAIRNAKLGGLLEHSPPPMIHRPVWIHD